MSLSCAGLVFPLLRAAISAGFQVNIKVSLTCAYQLSRVDLGASVLAGPPAGVFRESQNGNAEIFFYLL